MATFGETGGGIAQATGHYNRITGFLVTSPAGTGQLAESISVELRLLGSANIKCALYSSSGNLIASTEEKTVTDTSTHYEKFNFSTKPSISGSTSYYICVWGDANIAFGYANGDGWRWYSLPYTGNFPSYVSFETITNYHPAIYCTTVATPTVTTQSATNVAQTSCTGNGNITDTGGVNCTRRGFCYKVGTSGDPTTSDSVAYDDGDFGTGAFTKSITGLTAGTSYRVRAYAINSAGTGYGETVQVTTIKAFKPRTMWF
jgi:hypothetical protein